MITILVFIAVIAVLILVHEAGHFMAAKIMGVKVEKFSIGFGPKIVSKVWKDTEYKVSLIPFGGYVKLAGEQRNSEKPPLSWEFFGQKIWRRAVILIAGPLMNIILAWVIFCSVLYFGSPLYKAVIGEVKSGEPAAGAGLLEGDKILAIDNKPIKNWDEMAEVIYFHPEEPLSFKIERNAEELILKIVPRRETDTASLNEQIGRGLIGIFPDKEAIYYQRENFLNAVRKGTGQTLFLVRMIYNGLWKMVTGRISLKQLGGPILMAQITAQQVKFGFLPVLMYLALFSVNLAIINLLPIPILDGGHLMFLAAEKIKGGPVSLKIQEMAQTIGLVIIIGIMVLATFNDIHRQREKKREEKKLIYQKNGLLEVN